MSYNLLLDTQFTNSQWKYINCEYKNGVLVSNNKVFGIEQELILPEPTKLYFRINYIIDNISIKEVKIGIQNNDVLTINKKTPKLRKKQLISVIDNAKQEKIKLHIIFESDIDINKVQIEKPILCDLNYLGKSTWLKWLLDKIIYYKNGYTYTNIYKDSELLPNIEDFKEISPIQAQIGSIIKTKNNISLKITAKFIVNNYYLAKLDFKEINEFGKVYLKYGILKSVYTDKEQCYLLFKANNNELTLNIEPNDVLDYQVNLKHLMIIDITKMNLLQSDIKYLPFI